LQQSWSGPWGWWHGPHTSQSWPLTGGFELLGSGSGIYGFTGLPGRWTVLASESVEITADDIPATWTMESSTPTSSAPDVADWSSTSPIGPTAQFTDPVSVALLQDWIVVSAVGLGIGGGLLATMLLGWIQPTNKLTSEARDAELPTALGIASRHPRRRSRKHKTMQWLIAIGMAFFIGYARGKFRHRKI